MAKAIKLVDSFEGYKLVMSVCYESLDKVLKHCEKLGLIPAVNGYKDERILFQVVLPGSVYRIFLLEMEKFECTLYCFTNMRLVRPLLQL